MEGRFLDQRPPPTGQSGQCEIEHRAKDSGRKNSRRAKRASSWLQSAAITPIVARFNAISEGLATTPQRHAPIFVGGRRRNGSWRAPGAWVPGPPAGHRPANLSIASWVGN